MNSPDFREFRTTVLDAMAALQTETEHKLKDMATGQRASEYNAQWYLDMTNAAIQIMVERDLFTDDVSAEDTVTRRAEQIVKMRKEMQAGVAS